uniref:Uncharacterized protein n=1 Tax=Ditylenchus dipsaci TaxID=166011 RepID=A0A915DMI3_9BILA
MHRRISLESGDNIKKTVGITTINNVCVEQATNGQGNTSLTYCYQLGQTANPAKAKHARTKSEQSTQKASLDARNVQSSASSSNTSTSFNLRPMLPSSRLCLGGEMVEVPDILINDETLFRNVMKKSAFWSLSEPARQRLRRFLPLPISSREEEDKVLDCAFTNNESFCFGSPISKVFLKIKTGYFSAPHAADQVQLRDHRRVLYDHYIRHYYMNLLKKLLIGRQIILESASKLSSVEKVEINPTNYCSKKRLMGAKALQKRANIRAKKMIKDCEDRVEGGITSSEDEEDTCSSQMLLAPGAESTLYSKKFSDLDLHQPIKMKDVKDLLKEYHQLRETEPDCPSLDISDITLEEVYDRVGISFQSERNFAIFVNKNRSKELENTVPTTPGSQAESLLL